MRWRHNVDGCVENSDERISEVLETLLGKTESSVSSVSLRAHSHPAHDPASPQLPTAPRRYFLTVTALPSEGGRGRLPTRGPRAPVTTSCLTSHHDAISIWCDAGASAPGLLGKAAPGHSGSLHGCTVDARLVDVQLSTRLAVHVRYMVPDRTLFGRHRLQMPRWIRPPQGAANALWRSRRVLISTHLTRVVARGARELCRRLVETPSSKHLSGLPPTQHPPQPKLVHVVRGLAGPGSIGIGRGARGASAFLLLFPCGALSKCDEVSVIFLFKFGDYMPGGLATLRFSRT